MVLKSPKSKISVVNLFADFILNKIPLPNESIIQVVDCDNFLIIKGLTTYNSILNLGEIRDEFLSKYSEYLDDRKVFPTLDLIKYDIKLSPKNSLTHTYYNTRNCSYHQKQIDRFISDPEKSYNFNQVVREITDNSELTFSSEFPYGYSLGQGRLFYYYGKNIFYKIPSTYYVNSRTFTITNEKDDLGDVKLVVMDEQCESEDSVLKSAILDVFDFDMVKFAEEVKKMDWSLEMTNPLEDYECLKTPNKDFIIL